MAMHINFSQEVKKSCEEKEPRIHLMPCSIKTDDTANVSQYFEPLIVKNDENVYIASFRGFPLQGKEIVLPKNYHGIVVQEINEKMNEEEDRSAHVSCCFDKFMYWNWDKAPSKNDNLIAALDWIQISQVLHSTT